MRRSHRPALRVFRRILGGLAASRGIPAACRASEPAVRAPADPGQFLLPHGEPIAVLAARKACARLYYRRSQAPVRSLLEPQKRRPLHLATRDTRYARGG